MKRKKGASANNIWDKEGFQICGLGEKCKTMEQVSIFAEWNAYHRESYHVYGNIHNRLSDTCFIMRNRRNAYNAAACINNYVPSKLEEIIENNQRFVEETPLNWRDLQTNDFQIIY